MRKADTLLRRFRDACSARRWAVYSLGFLPVVWLAVRLLPLWRIRRWWAVRLVRLPDRWLPTHLRVLPPPDSEYLGVWEVPPDEARSRLETRYGFRQQVRAYLHAYERHGTIRYEQASCAYRPNGLLGGWQLHVRLFSAAGGTAVWCHWERNPNVAPLAHLRRDGYDPDAGKQRLLELLDEPLRVADESGHAPPYPDRD
ncbi:uncharacterized protein NP_3622A [Natronomonas pharaonis DSM 2160]|uniref:Uncharacterized protein n=1 Tax=Natronomonas pharaonis (strain ATCC 35678 / DSM 2160 / CIP 103997 / JCM 8858 / NBRC 14720 / NCIMB 2260 / Gabara) TaxID=348780 RepID=A0A1U7EXJ5_NATPD|nr:uncharacterized protein NP_3622A [Natronomonas pharaonis DSM 2160]